MVRLLLACCLFLAAVASAEAQSNAAEPPVRIPEESPAAANLNGEVDLSPAGATGDAAAEPETPSPPVAWPLICLAVGIAIVLGLIVGFKVNAFLALISAALVVSLLAGGPWTARISRVAFEFGASAGGIGIVIALAAVIGKCLLDSGAADRIVRMFLNVFGERRSPIALMGSGFVLAVPVFFDTVFYLLVPLARSLYRRTQSHYLLYLLAIGAGGAITHTLVPPTPGPLLVAANLNVDLGTMILAGSAVALVGGVAGLMFGHLADAWFPLEMRPLTSEEESKPLPDDALPPLAVALAPVLLPVVLISASTIASTVADEEGVARLKADQIDWKALAASVEDPEATSAPAIAEQVAAALSPEQRTQLAQGPTAEQQAALAAALNAQVLESREFADAVDATALQVDPAAVKLLGGDRLRQGRAEIERLNRLLLEAWSPAFEPHVYDTPRRQTAMVLAVVGNPVLALLMSTIIAITTLAVQRGYGRDEVAKAVEESLMSGGVIILITASGGAFGAMLREAGVGEAIKTLAGGQSGGSGLIFLCLGFGIAALLKTAQGSSTVAMITASSMLAGATADQLGFHPVYLATAIGGGSLVVSWMNDSGFWIFAKMGGLTEIEALRSWTVMLIVLGVSSFAATVLLAWLLPLV